MLHVCLRYLDYLGSIEESKPRRSEWHNRRFGLKTNPSTSCTLQPATCIGDMPGRRSFLVMPIPESSMVRVDLVLSMISEVGPCGCCMSGVQCTQERERERVQCRVQCREGKARRAWTRLKQPSSSSIELPQFPNPCLLPFLTRSESETQEL